MALTLYSYFRSTAAYRVRIALNLKGIEHAIVPVHLVRGGGEHHADWFGAINPQQRIPALAVDAGERGPDVLVQSPAILEWIEETWPHPALLPGDAIARAKARAIAALICCDIHPLNNMGVLNYLRDVLGQDKAAVDQWYAHWVTQGFTALEQMIVDDAHGPFALGSAGPTMADVCIVPQVYNARRFNVPIDAFPRICRVEAACLARPAFAAASPALQPDAE